MGRTSTRALRDLPGALDQDSLHIFLVGPGVGEAVALALPNGNWILVDSCRIGRGGRRKNPLEEIVAKHSAAHPYVSHMLLTHPHDDHTDGLTDLIEACGPRYVGLTGPCPQRNIAVEAELPIPVGVTSKSGRRNKALTALERLHFWGEQNPGCLLSLADGCSLLGVKGMEVAVRAPDPDLIERWWQQNKLKEVLRDRANALSLVLELVWGEARVLLGGDLPVTLSGADVATGWNHVVGRHPEIGDAHIFKVPHHGSRESLLESVLKAARKDPVWLIAPNSRSGLPNDADSEGLAILLSHESPVCVTSALGSWHCQTNGAENARAELTNTNPEPVAGVFRASDRLRKAGPHPEPLDPVWYVAIDVKGKLTDLRAGVAALRVRR